MLNYTIPFPSAKTSCQRKTRIDLRSPVGQNGPDLISATMSGGPLASTNQSPPAPVLFATSNNGPAASIRCILNAGGLRNVDFAKNYNLDCLLQSTNLH